MCKFNGAANFWASPSNSSRKTTPDTLKFSSLRPLAEGQTGQFTAVCLYAWLSTKNALHPYHTKKQEVMNPISLPYPIIPGIHKVWGIPVPYENAVPYIMHRPVRTHPTASNTSNHTWMHSLASRCIWTGLKASQSLQKLWKSAREFAKNNEIQLHFAPGCIYTNNIVVHISYQYCILTNGGDDEPARKQTNISVQKGHRRIDHHHSHLSSH